MVVADIVAAVVVDAGIAGSMWRRSVTAAAVIAILLTRALF